MKTECIITRRTGNPIVLDEWIRYVKSRKDLEIPEIFLSFPSTGKKRESGKLVNPKSVKWATTDKNGKKITIRLLFAHNSIICKNPTFQHISELKNMANALNAELTDDEGITY